MNNQPKNILISDIEINYPRLDTPMENPFGGVPAWEMQIATDSSEKAEELRKEGLNVKEKDGQYVVNLKRKSLRADGNPMDPVRVVDGNKQPIDSTGRRRIGNGSRGNVIVWAAPYSNMGRTGVSFSLTAVQVTDLVEYTGSTTVDFDVVSDNDGSPSSENLF